MDILKNTEFVAFQVAEPIRPGINVLMLLLVYVSYVCAADSTGQKAHFQLEDKSGELKITATKDQAKVTTQADSVQVVVKPGTAIYPVLKSDKPIVHVTHPGWNTISFRKSAILKGKTSFTTVVDQRESTRQKTPLLYLTHNLKHTKKSSPPRNPSAEPIANAFLARVKNKKSHFAKRKHRGKTPQIVQDVSGSKKSSVKGFQVSGTAGKLKMHVTKDETELSSESGGVDISLSPISFLSKTNQQSSQAEADSKGVQLATGLGDIAGYVGLKKSVLLKLPDVKADCA